MVIEPLPASALVLLGLTAMVANGTPLRETFGGYAEPSVWLVVAAMLVARSLRQQNYSVAKPRSAPLR